VSRKELTKPSESGPTSVYRAGIKKEQTSALENAEKVIKHTLKLNPEETNSRAGRPKYHSSKKAAPRTKVDPQSCTHEQHETGLIPTLEVQAQGNKQL